MIPCLTESELWAGPTLLASLVLSRNIKFGQGITLVSIPWSHCTGIVCGQKGKSETQKILLVTESTDFY